MDVAFLIGRIIFAGYWLMSALNHFKNLKHMSEYAKTKANPFPKLAVGGTGVLVLGGGLSMLLGVYPPVGVAQRLMRHSDIRTTMNQYGDALTDDMRQAHSKMVSLALAQA